MSYELNSTRYAIDIQLTLGKIHTYNGENYVVDDQPADLTPMLLRYPMGHSNYDGCGGVTSAV